MSKKYTNARAISVVLAGSLALSATLFNGCNRDPNARKQSYLESGRRYQAEGKYRESVIQFLNALKVDRNLTEAHLLLARSYMHMGATDPAIAELQQALQQRPADSSARIDLSGLLLRRGDAAGAAAQARAVLAAQPQNAEAHAILADAAFAQNNPAVAITELRQAIALAPGRSDFHSSLGSLEAGSDATAADARKEFATAVQLDGANLPARLGLANLLAKGNDLPGAAQQLEAAIQTSPAQAGPRTALADVQLRMGHAEAAEATLRSAANDLPNDAEAASALAGFYMRTNQPAKAVDSYRDLVKQHPDSTPLRLALARALLVDGRNDEAAGTVDQLAKGNSSDPEVIALRATLLRHQGKNADALRLLNDSVHTDPENVKLRLLLGMAAADEGDLPLAQTSYQEALTRDPHNPNAQRGLADIANRRGDGTTLRQVAASGIADRPAQADGYLWRATAEMNDGQLDLAARDLAEALRRDPGNDQAVLALAEVRTRQKRAPEAAALLQQAVAANPRSHALPLLVRSDLEAGQPGRALARVQAQIARAPNDAGLYTQLAAVQLAAKDPRAALASAQKAMALSPDDPNAMRSYTQAQIALGEVEPAIGVWQRWSADHPRSAAGPAMLGMLYEANSDANNAVTCYRASLRINPSQPVAANNLAYLLADSGGNLDEALSLAQTAHAAMPSSADAADTLAWVYFHRGAYGSALELLQQAEAQDRSNASIQLHLGMTLARLNRKADAADHLKKVPTLTTDPTLAQDAQKELARLG